MKSSSADTRALKVHQDTEGRIWYLNGEGVPEQTDHTWRDFMQQPIMQKAKHIRLIGSQENAKAIVQLYARRKDHSLEKLEVCSPMVCLTAQERNNPETALYNMRNWNWASSIGGWHEVTEKDYASYLLAFEIQKAKYKIDDNVRRVIKIHPAWAALSFITHLNVDNLCVLLGLLLDPRWYIDFDDPNSSAKLKAFLGLTPKHQKASKDGDTTTVHAGRCKLVLDTWKTSDNEPSNIHHPSNFLWRTWCHHNKSETGELRASQSFITFLRHTWSDALYPKQSEPLFIAKYFFKHEEEALAFDHHMKNFKVT